MRFFSSLSSMTWFFGACKLEKFAVRLWPASCLSNRICVALSISPFAIVTQCFTSKKELSGNISWSTSHSSEKKSQPELSVDPQSLVSDRCCVRLALFELVSTPSEMDGGLALSFDSGIISERLSDLDGWWSWNRIESVAMVIKNRIWIQNLLEWKILRIGSLIQTGQLVLQLKYPRAYGCWINSWKLWEIGGHHFNKT